MNPANWDADFIRAQIPQLEALHESIKGHPLMAPPIKSLLDKCQATLTQKNETPMTKQENQEERDRMMIATHLCAGILSNPGGPLQHSPISGWYWCNCAEEDPAIIAVRLADHLLAALAGPKGDKP